MNNIFDAPPEGALQTVTDRALKIEYRSMKIPKDFADKATQSAFADYLKNGSLGFRYWDKELKQGFVMTEFTFVVLEVYAGVAGFDKEGNVSYWSNRVKDTRKEPMIVFASNQKDALAKGFYTKGGVVGGEQLPKPASYTKFVRAYCVQLDRVVEIVLTAASERGMQKGIEAAEREAGRIKSKWESVFILGLADNNHLWGFHLTGYNRETDKGEDYAGKGELYLAPVFHAGVLNPTKQAEMWAKCRELQEAERAAHEAYRAKYQQTETVRATETPQAEYHAAPANTETEPINTTVTANHEAPDDLPF